MVSRTKQIGVKGWLTSKQPTEATYMVEGCADTLHDAEKLMRWVMLRERFRFVPEAEMQNVEKPIRELLKIRKEWNENDDGNGPSQVLRDVLHCLDDLAAVLEPQRKGRKR